MPGPMIPAVIVLVIFIRTIGRVGARNTVPNMLLLWQPSCGKDIDSDMAVVAAALEGRAHPVFNVISCVQLGVRSLLYFVVFSNKREAPWNAGQSYTQGLSH